MKKLSEQLLEMSERAAAAENQAAAIQQENRQEFEATVAEAQRNLHAAQDAFTATLDKVEDSVSVHWAELKNSFDTHVATARQKAAERKAAFDLATAKERAEDAEAYAEIAAEFAHLAAAEAEEAMIEAKLARAAANAKQ